MTIFVIPLWYEDIRHPPPEPVLRRRPLPEFPPGGRTITHDAAAAVARHQDAGRAAGHAIVRTGHARRGLDAGGTHFIAASTAYFAIAGAGRAIIAARHGPRTLAPGLDQLGRSWPVPILAGSFGVIPANVHTGIDGSAVAAPDRRRAQGPA